MERLLSAFISQALVQPLVLCGFGQLLDLNFNSKLKKMILNNNTSQYCDNNLKLVSIALYGLFMVIYSERDQSFLVSVKHQLLQYFLRYVSF